MNLRVQIPGGTNALTRLGLKSPTHESDEASLGNNDIKDRASDSWILMPDDPIIAVAKVLLKGQSTCRHSLEQLRTRRRATFSTTKVPSVGVTFGCRQRVLLGEVLSLVKLLGKASHHGMWPERPDG